MKKRSREPLLIVLCAVLVVAAIALFFYSRSATRLAPVEVRDYQGQKLSSINDIVDNAISGTQYIDVNNYTLVVDGLVNHAKAYSYSDALSHQHYEKVVTINCVEGWSATILCEGVMLKDLFNETGISPEANTVIFYASDGYTTSLPLDYIMNNSIMIAYKMNGVVLPAAKGFPFMLVAESKYGYKWIKWITRIELSNDSSYTGYWESRGYSNGADV